MKLIGRRILSAAALLAACLSSSAIAREALVLEPSSPWTIDYDADSCALRRNFGGEERRTQLEMRRFQPGLRLQAMVITKAAKMTKRGYRFRFGQAAEWTKVESPLYASFDQGFEGVIFGHSLVEPRFDSDVKPEEWSQLFIDNDVAAMETEAGAKVQDLTISRAFKDDLVLKTGSLKEPLLALNQCIDELMTHWGIDAEAHKTRTRSAIPLNLPRAARLLDYPPKMLQQGLPGLVNIRLEIDQTGQVTGCQIQMPLSDPAFEKESCSELERLKFDPALDKHGRPMKSYYVTSVRFQLS